MSTQENSEPSGRRGGEEQDESYQNADNKEFDEMAFVEGFVGKKFTNIIRKILLTPREAKQSKSRVLFKTSY